MFDFAIGNAVPAHSCCHVFVEQYYEQRGNSLIWDLVQATLEKIYRDEGLVEQAKQHLACAKVHNVLALPGDGFLGEAIYAPYDRLLTTCSIRSVPRAWFDQLKLIFL